MNNNLYNSLNNILSNGIENSNSIKYMFFKMICLIIIIILIVCFIKNLFSITIIVLLLSILYLQLRQNKDIILLNIPKKIINFIQLK
jgi:hypothetical protein